MTMHSADDIQAAEDHLGTAVHALEALLEVLADLVDVEEYCIGADRAVIDTARSVVAQWGEYCRPTCGARGEDTLFGGCRDDLCGCPCHAEQEWDEFGDVWADTPLVRPTEDVPVNGGLL